MTPTLTSPSDLILTDPKWIEETTNTPPVSHPATANAAAIALGGLWKGHKIDAADIQETRRDLWGKVEAGE